MYTLANLSKLPTTAINAVRRILRWRATRQSDDAFSCLRSLPHGHVAAVLATVRKLGLPTLLARSPGRVRDLVVALLVARVIDAQSKLATARALTPESAVSTLGEMLDLGTVDPKELYAAMDWLVERQAAIEQRLAKRHLQEHTLVLYDLTSSYVEGTHCELAPARPQPRPQEGHAPDRLRSALHGHRLSGRRRGLRRLDQRPQHRRRAGRQDPHPLRPPPRGARRRPRHADRGPHPRGPRRRRRAALDHHPARTDHPQARGCRHRYSVAVRRTRPRRGRCVCRDAGTPRCCSRNRRATSATTSRTPTRSAGFGPTGSSTIRRSPGRMRAPVHGPGRSRSRGERRSQRNRSDVFGQRPWNLRAAGLRPISANLFTQPAPAAARSNRSTWRAATAGAVAAPQARRRSFASR